MSSLNLLSIENTKEDVLQYVRLDIVKYLIENTDDGLKHALVWCVCAGHLNIVKYLAEKDTDIHIHFDIMLRCGVSNGHLNIVKYLVEKGVDIHACSEFALRYSAEGGHLDVVKFLVEKGADIHANSEETLRWSAKNGHLDVVKYLIEKGAKIPDDPDMKKIVIYVSSIQKNDDIYSIDAYIHEWLWKP